MISFARGRRRVITLSSAILLRGTDFAARVLEAVCNQQDFTKDLVGLHDSGR